MEVVSNNINSMLLLLNTLTMIYIYIQTTDKKQK